MNPSAVAAIVLLAVVGCLQAEVIVDGHVHFQDMCSSLPDLSRVLGDSFKQKTEEEKKKTVEIFENVCRIYDRTFIFPEDTNSGVETRDILGGLSGLLGDNSKLGTLLKAAEALNKAKGVLEDVKKIKPELHKHVQGGIEDIHNSLQDLIDSIANEFTGKASTPKY